MQRKEFSNFLKLYKAKVSFPGNENLARENSFAGKAVFLLLQAIGDPQFANCKGFLYYAGLLEQRIKSTWL